MNARIFTVLSGLAILGSALYVYFTQTKPEIVEHHTQFYLEGYDSILNNKIELLLNSSGVYYDITSNLTDNNGQQIVTRYLDNKMYRIAGETVEELDMVNNELGMHQEPYMIMNDTHIEIEYMGSVLSVELVNHIPIKFASFDVTLFDIMPQKVFYPIAIHSSVRDRARALNAVSNKYPSACILNIIMGSYAKGGNYVNTGYCNGKSIVAFQGTKDSDDIISDVVGFFDNFERGFNAIQGFDGRRYDVCVGHSLGAAIAKFAAIKGLCSEVIGIATPLTRNFPANIPVTQYASYGRGPDSWWYCCSYTWYGGCSRYNMKIIDPVTRVGTNGGNALNVIPVGPKESYSCVGSDLTILGGIMTTKNLHFIPYYQPYLADRNI